MCLFFLLLRETEYNLIIKLKITKLKKTIKHKEKCLFILRNRINLYHK